MSGFPLKYLESFPGYFWVNFQDFPGHFLSQFPWNFYPKMKTEFQISKKWNNSHHSKFQINLNFLKFINFQDFPGHFALFQDIFSFPGLSRKWEPCDIHGTIKKVPRLHCAREVLQNAQVLPDDVIVFVAQIQILKLF